MGIIEAILKKRKQRSYLNVLNDLENSITGIYFTKQNLEKVESLLKGTEFEGLKNFEVIEKCNHSIEMMRKMQKLLTDYANEVHELDIRFEVKE